MKRFLCLCAAAAAAAGCGGKDDVFEAEHTFHPLENTECVTELSSFIDEMSYVRLADDERLFLAGGISKALLDGNGNIHVLDFGGNVASIGHDGTPFGHVTRKGRAAGEYVSASDIALNGNELIVLEGPSVKFFSLDLSGNVRSAGLDSGLPFDAVAPCGKDGIYAFSSYPASPEDFSEKTDMLYRFGPDGGPVPCGIVREDCTFSMGNISQSSGNTYFLRPQNSRHIFCRLEERGAVPAYRVDFGDKAIPERYYFNAAGEDVTKYMTADYYKLPMDLHLTSSHAYFHACGPGAEDTGFVLGTDSGKGIRWTNEGGDMALNLFGADEDSFYALMLPCESYGSPGHGALYSLVAGYLLKEGQSPDGTYVVRIKFKDF